MQRGEMGNGRQIVGVWLLRDEEYFAAWSLMNAVEFCDRVLVMDNRSRDRTREITEAVAARYSHVNVLDVDDACDTHKYLEEYAGTPTWVFGIDGDEIYDPAGLKRMRPRLLAGEFDGHWRIAGHMLHVLGIRFDRTEACGYAQPKAPEVTKLFNFGAVESWRPGPHERLHGFKSIVFRPEFGRDNILKVWRQESWDEANFRCLHLAFMPRSPLNSPKPDEFSWPVGRANPSERMKAQSLLRRIRRAVLRRLDLHHNTKKNYKHRHYAKGPIVIHNIAEFGAPDRCSAVDRGYANALETLRMTTDQRKAMRP